MWECVVQLLNSKTLLTIKINQYQVRARYHYGIVVFVKQKYVCYHGILVIWSDSALSKLRSQILLEKKTDQVRGSSFK